jgi:hypothetical protein
MCNGTACAYTCKGGFGDCLRIGADTDGCETSLDTLQNCSACGAACDTVHSMGAMCNGATCTYAGCLAGYGDCAMAAPDADGCETNFSSPGNCGACGRACDAAHSNGASCSAGACSYASCKSGFADCAGMPPDLDGCETPTTTTSNCGGCGNVCSVANANSAMCDGTSCSYSCKAGFADCVNTPPDVNGCETATTTTANCGGCGNACTLNHASADACNGTSCSYTCSPGFGDCASAAPDLDGCETSLTTIANCGGCGRACDTVESNGASCNGGLCQYTSCKAGFADCSVAGGDVDGCETPTTTTTNCGGCGNVCTLNHATAAGCNGTSCSYTCAAGFADCVKNGADLDGCESSLSSTSSCSGCGVVCDTVHSNGAACNGLTCSYASCKAGFVDCNTTAPDENGCESQLHPNGLGQTYVDCADPLGVPGMPAGYNLNMATFARAASTIVGTDGAATCGAANCLYRQAIASCAVWCYSTTIAGYVFLNNADATCFCPDATDAQWN